jgi:hypothetical protein
LCLGSDFDEIELSIDSELPSSLDGDDAEGLLGRVVEEPDTRDPDLVVDAELAECDGSLSSWGRFLLQ